MYISASDLRVASYQSVVTNQHWLVYMTPPVLTHCLREYVRFLSVINVGLSIMYISALLLTCELHLIRVRRHKSTLTGLWLHLSWHIACESMFGFWCVFNDVACVVSVVSVSVSDCLEKTVLRKGLLNKELGYRWQTARRTCANVMAWLIPVKRGSTYRAF